MIKRTINDYLKGLVKSQKIRNKELEEMRQDRNYFEDLINQIDELSRPSYYWSGSYGKNTMIKDSYDIDILCYFLSNDPHPLDEIFMIVKNHILSVEPNAYQKNVAIRIEKREGYHIDIVPAKRSSTNESIAYLYKSQEKRRITTSVEKQIQILRDFGRRNLLKLVKLWKCRNNIDIPSFLVEIITIKENEEERITLENGLKKVFQFIANRIESCNIPDPANTSNNIAADAISDPNEKQKAKKVAEWCLSLNLKTIEGWKEVFRNKDHSNAIIEKNITEYENTGFKEFINISLKVGAGILGFKVLKWIFSKKKEENQ